MPPCLIPLTIINAPVSMGFTTSGIAFPPLGSADGVRVVLAHWGSDNIRVLMVFDIQESTVREVQENLTCASD